MPDLVDYTTHGAIGVITINNPPVNALSPGVPEGIYEGLQQGMKDPTIKAMVLIGGGRSFIAGADIKHVGKKKSPIGAKWRDEMEKMDKPVVAAIHGYAFLCELGATHSIGQVSRGCEWFAPVDASFDSRGATLPLV